MAFYEPWVEKNSRTGRFCVRWRTPDGKQPYDEIWYENKNDAKERRDIVRKKLVNQSLGRFDGSETVEKCFEEFLAEKETERLKEKSLECFHVSYATLRPFVSTLTNFDDKVLEKYRLDLYSRGYTLETIITRLSRIRTFVLWLVKKKKFVIDMERYAIPVRRPKPRFFTDDELKKIEEICEDKEFIAFVRLGYQCGLREGEILRLRGGDVVYYKPSNCYGITISADAVKSERARTVYAPMSVITLLPKILNQNDLYFPFWSANRVAHFFARIKRRLGILPEYDSKGRLVKNATFHSFRHTYARLYLESGGDMRALMIDMGHSSLAMVQIYQHLETKHRFRASAAAFGILQGRSENVAGLLQGRIAQNGGTSLNRDEHQQQLGGEVVSSSTV